MVSHNFYYSTIYLFLAKYCAAWGTQTQKILSHSKNIKKTLFKGDKCRKCKKRRVKVCFNKTNYVFEFDHSKNIVVIHFIPDFIIFN